MPEVPEPSAKRGLVTEEQSASCANRYAVGPCGVGMKIAQLAQQDDQQNSSKSVPDSPLTLQPIGGPPLGVDFRIRIVDHRLRRILLWPNQSSCHTHVADVFVLVDQRNLPPSRDRKTSTIR